MLIGILIYVINCDINEHYYIYDNLSYCKSCGEKSRIECNKCINCGYCRTPNGNGECVPGDEKGPYFREDCVDYEYNTPIYSYFSSWFYPFWGRDKYNYDTRGYPTHYPRKIHNRQYVHNNHNEYNKYTHNMSNQNNQNGYIHNRQPIRKDVYKNK